MGCVTSAIAWTRPDTPDTSDAHQLGLRPRNEEPINHPGVEPNSQLSGTSQLLQNIRLSGGILNVAARDVHHHSHYHRTESSAISSLPPILEPITNFRDIHIATLGRATAGTGAWIRAFGSWAIWLDRDGSLRILWGSGIPGAGKTVLASIVINTLEEHARTSPFPICVCYIYFRYSDRKEASVQSYLETLVKQTLERHPEYQPLFDEVYARHIREQTRPTEEELLQLLKKFAQDMTTFYILEALDEAPAEIQLDIVQKLASLKVKLFITSRPLKTIDGAFPDAHRFIIAAQDQDLDLHIAKEISLSGDLRTILERADPLLRDRVFHSIKQNCGGMFLHASLQLARLRECTSPHEVEATLAAFPSDIKDLYLQTWQRILNHNTSTRVSLAKTVLVWVLTSTRSLTVAELQDAVATCPITLRYQKARVVQEDTLIGLCHGLVNVEEKTHFVRLVHYTAEDVLVRLIDKDFEKPHSFLASVCMARLTEHGFHSMAPTCGADIDEALCAQPLLTYAYQYWSAHARRSLDDQRAVDRLAEFIKRCHSFPATLEPSYFTLGSWDLLGPLHLAAFFELPLTLVHSELLQDPNVGPARAGMTALSLACIANSEAAAQALLHLPNILINTADLMNTTALNYAAAAGRQGLVRLLLARSDIEVEVEDNSGLTALMWAALKGREEIVQLLLSHSQTNINRQGETRMWTALILASEGGYEGTVRLLLAHPGTDVNLAGKGGRTPLIHASEHGHEATVRVLLSHSSIQVNIADIWKGETPLILASKMRHKSVLKLLLSHPDTDVNAVDRSGRTALSWALQAGCEASVESLLAHPEINVNVDHQDWWAAARHEGVLKPLLRRNNVRYNHVCTGLCSRAIIRRPSCGRFPLNP